MQTFLPYPDFQRSAQSLDRARLGKQRVEVKQILLALQNESGWRHHPAVRMWTGYEPALAAYGLVCCDEWVRRGYKDSLAPFFLATMGDAPLVLPPWFGNADFHQAHRSNLKRKDPVHYKGFTESSTLPYVWPVQ